MAKIPRSNISQSVIRTTPTLARRGSSGKSQTAGIVGQTIVNVAEMVEKVRINEETSRADNNFMRSMLDIEREANENTDVSPEKQKEFKQRITDARVESARFIKQPLAREEFTARATGKENILNSKIQGIFGKKIIDRDRANVQENLSLLKESFITASNSKQRTALMKEASSLLDSRAKAGTISFELASLRKLQIKDEWAIEDAESDIIANADVSLEELKKGKKGLYPTLKTTDRQALISKAEKQVANNIKRIETFKAEQEAQQEAQWNSSDGQAITQFLNKQATAQEIQIMAEEGKISPQVGKAMAGISLSKASVKAKTDDDSYFKLLEQFYAIDDSNFKAVNKWRASVLATHEKAKLSRDDANELITKSILPLQGKVDTKPKKTSIGQSLSQMRDWSTSVLDEPGQAIAQSRMARTFFKSLTGVEINQENIEKATEIAIVEEQKINNPNRSKYQLNKTYNSPGGAFKVIGYREDGEPMIEVQ